MRFRLLDLLICPDCKNILHCDVLIKSKVDISRQINISTCQFWCAFHNVNLLESEAKITDCQACQEIEIIDGILKCSCGKSYPVAGGIPRILPPSLRPVEKKTARKFGYEWTKFSDYEVENFAIFMKFLAPNFFCGKVGLDAGCGAGRHLVRLSDLGAEAIGFDLSNSVDVVYQKTFHLPGIHIVQCDVSYLPFRKDVFDFIYSLGMLHHLLDPNKGFKGLIPFLKPGSGTIFFLVYQRSLRKLLLEPIRAITTRLPEEVVYWISSIAAIFDYGILGQRYHLLKEIPILGKIADLLTPRRVKEYSQYPFRVSIADWFDRLSAPISRSYSQEEIKRWLESEHLADIRVSAIDSSWIYGYGVRKNI